MTKRVDQLPAVLTSFAYREEYFPELDGMLATVRRHHPDWNVVTGRGPVLGFDKPALEVEFPSGKCHWSLPIPFELEGTENDWLRIVWMKGWWMAQVWHIFGGLSGPDGNRVIWLDADARLNGPLDIEFDSQAELVAGPWAAVGPMTPVEHVCSGLLLFQGARNGIVETMIDQWSAGCISYIQSPPSPNPIWPWGEGDQEVLTTVLKSCIAANGNYTLLKLECDKYCGEVNSFGTPKPGALVDQWMMNDKMRLPQNRDLNWPPPEEARQRQMKPALNCEKQ
jgi:hypothetical protein